MCCGCGIDMLGGFDIDMLDCVVRVVRVVRWLKLIIIVYLIKELFTCMNRIYCILKLNFYT